jgi:hypothetical protein
MEDVPVTIQYVSKQTLFLTLRSYLNRCTLPCRSERGMDAFRPH